MKTLAIIGTAGRKEDAKKLRASHWYQMIDAAKKVVELEGCDRLVSGGAAWADHVAVHLGREESFPVQIWMPDKQKDLDVAEYYHKSFSDTIKKKTWLDLHNSFDNLGNFNLGYIGGFKDRNTRVAEEANVFLAMTFGYKGNVKDGGTADTVRKMKNRGIHGYHLDLNYLSLYKCT